MKRLVIGLALGLLLAGAAANTAVRAWVDCDCETKVKKTFGYCGLAIPASKCLEVDGDSYEFVTECDCYIWGQ